MTAPVNTNVVPFRRRQPSRQTFTIAAVIEPTEDLRDGEMVAFQLKNRDGTYSQSVLLGRWYGPEGRDCSGRFVKKGSPRECAYLDGFSYRPASDFVKVLGRVAWAGFMP